MVDPVLLKIDGPFDELYYCISLIDAHYHVLVVPLISKVNISNSFGRKSLIVFLSTGH